MKNDVKWYYQKSRGYSTDLWAVPKSVGGSVDMIIVIRYFCYSPKLIFLLPSCLAIYEFMFQNSGGSNGVTGAPHEVFTEIDKKFHRCNFDDNFFDKSKFYFIQRFKCYTKLIVKELLYSKIKFFTSISKSVVNYIKITVTNISNNIIKQYYGII